jgi:hypothetical protein
VDTVKFIEFAGYKNPVTVTEEKILPRWKLLCKVSGAILTKHAESYNIKFLFPEI